MVVQSIQSRCLSGNRRASEPSCAVFYKEVQRCHVHTNPSCYLNPTVHVQLNNLNWHGNYRPRLSILGKLEAVEHFWDFSQSGTAFGLGYGISLGLSVVLAEMSLTSLTLLGPVVRSAIRSIPCPITWQQAIHLEPWTWMAKEESCLTRKS